MTDRHADFAESLLSDLDAFSRRFAGELSTSASAALDALRARCADGRELAAASASVTNLRGDSLAMIVAELDECRRAQTVLMDNLPGMVYRCRNDPEWTMEFVSPGCAELTGYPPEELTRNQGMSYGQLIHPDDRQQVWDTVQRSIRSMQPFVVGYRIITRGGEVRWVRERGRGVYAGGQYLRALEGVVTDISEQQRAQEETRRSAAYFRALIEHAFEAIFVIHPDGAIQYVSPSVETMLGYSVGELVGRDILGLVHEGDQAAARDGIEGVVARTRNEPLEVRLLARDGSIRVVRVVGTNLVDDPAVGGVIVNARDVTERRALSQRLAVEHAATALLTQSTHVEQAIPRILPMLAEGLGWDAATFWMVDDAAGLLQWEAEWHRPELADCGLVHLGRQLVFLPGVGLPGRVWARREPLWIERLDESTGLPRSKAAADDGIGTGFAVPVVAGDRCFGVLELLCCAPRSPEHSLIQSVATIGGVLGQFISRIRAEEALRASERYFRSLTENALDVITVLDDRGRIRYKSPAVTPALGYTPGELLGRDVFSLLHPADVDRAREVFGGAVRNPRVPHALEVRFRHSDGGWRSLALILASLLDDPAVAGVVANSRDITEQKLAEEQLRRTHETLTALVRNAPLAIVAVDDRFNVTMWNPAAERIFGWTTEEVLGKPYPIVPPDRVQESERFRDALFIEGRGLDGVELVRRRKDGMEVDVFCQSVILSDAMGHPASAVGFFTDVSERKYLQEQLRQSQKMEAIGRLAGGIAHDFNNLLTAIKGGAQLALMEVPVGTPLREDLEEIDAVADRAAALTRQLLAFSRKQVLRPEILDLGEVARRLEPMLRRLIHEEIELVTVVDPRAGTVLADAGQMEQILVNLALNARDAMPEGGTPDHRGTPRRLPGQGRCLRCARGAGGTSRPVDGPGHGHRDGRGDAGTHLRALLLHQGARQGDRSWTRHRVRDRQAEWWLHLGGQQGGEGDTGQDLSPGGGWHRRRAGTARPQRRGGRLGDHPAGGGRAERARARRAYPVHGRLHGDRRQRRRAGVAARGDARRPARHSGDGRGHAPDGRQGAGGAALRTLGGAAGPLPVGLQRGRDRPPRGAGSRSAPAGEAVRAGRSPARHTRRAGGGTAGRIAEPRGGDRGAAEQATRQEASGYTPSTESRRGNGASHGAVPPSLQSRRSRAPLRPLLARLGSPGGAVAPVAARALVALAPLLVPWRAGSPLAVTLARGAVAPWSAARAWTRSRTWAGTRCAYRALLGVALQRFRHALQLPRPGEQRLSLALQLVRHLQQLVGRGAARTAGPRRGVVVAGAALARRTGALLSERGHGRLTHGWRKGRIAASRRSKLPPPGSSRNPGAGRGPTAR